MSLLRPGRQAASAFIFVTVILDMLAFGMLAPVLPQIILEFEGGDASAAARENGLLGFVWAGMQFLAMPVIGGLSDRYGRRAVILISTFGLAISFLLTALAPTILWLYAARIVSGATSATFSVANAYIADVTPPGERARAYGLVAAAFGLGFIVGPAVGGILGQPLVLDGHLVIDGSPRLPFYLAAALSLVNAAYGWFVVPESLPPDQRRPFSLANANPFGALRFIFRRGDLAALTLTTFITYFVHTIYPSLYTLYLISVFGWSTGGAGLVLMLVGLASVVEGAFLVQPMIRWFGERGAIVIGLAAWGAGLLVCGIARDGYSMQISLVFGLLSAAAAPAMTSIMTRLVGPDEQGALQGSLGTLRGIADMIGPVALSTGLFAYGMRPDIGVPGLPWLVTAALIGISTMLAWPATRKTGPVEVPAGE